MTTALRERDNLLARLDAARDALTEAGTFEDVKRIRDAADAIGVLLLRQRMGFAAQQDAAILRLRAERRLGSMLPDIITNGGAPESHAVTLDSLGIGRMQSLRWQRAAAVPENQFEAYLSACFAHGREITQAAVLRLSAQSNGKHDDPDLGAMFADLLASHVRRIGEQVKALEHLKDDPNGEGIEWDEAIGHLQAAREVLERGDTEGELK